MFILTDICQVIFRYVLIMRKLLKIKCSYLKIFGAFSFELTNSHLFQQKLLPVYTTLSSPWRNFSGNAVASSNWSWSLISASKFHWRVQPTAARRSGRFKMNYGFACIARVSQQCLLENCPQMIEKEQLPPNNSPNSNAMEISRPKQFLNSKLHWRRYRTIFCRSN